MPQAGVETTTPSFHAIFAAVSCLFRGRARDFVMQRRDFIVGLGGALVWPAIAHTQDLPQRRIGILSIAVENDAFTQDLLRVFIKRMGELGWVEGPNIKIDYRFASNDSALLYAYARELVALRPDVLFAAAKSS